MSTPIATTLAPQSIATVDFRSIYSNGDLILVNPQQSTVIFVSVIVCSTLLEYLITRLQSAKNKYLRTIVVASKDEITNIGFVQMLLLFVVYSFPLSGSWAAVILWVTMCLLYMAITYVIMASIVLALLRLQGNRWRIFEWARIDADAHHTGSEQLFKTARQYFVAAVRSQNENDNADLDEKLEDTSLVAFSSYLMRIQRRNLRQVTDFGFKTWFGCGLMIVINGSRAITAASIDRSNVLLQVLSFVGVSGYGTILLFLVAHTMFQRRLRRFLVARVLELKKKTEPTLQAGVFDERLDRPPEDVGPVKLDRSVTPQQCFFFRSMSATLEMFKIVQLCLMWYFAVGIMAYAFVAWDAVQWFALLIYAGAAIPLLIFLRVYPWTVNLIMICQSLGDHFDMDLVKALLGDNDVETDSDSDGSDDDGDKGDGKKREGLAPAELDAELREVEDEWNGEHVVTLHETVPPDMKPQGEPSKLVGVAPRAKFERKAARPVFHQTFGQPSDRRSSRVTL
jgi:hypothetical protein